ncbi:MAG: L-seryl-tRNA(Sec) selenium transferase, partial [Planctomycetes bacterium]|nr:L-seryl-tRNA(Sec) selenium transferase [Planctomycetota bacterium]
APLAQEALRAIYDAAAAYCPLEVDVQSGKRGSRTTHVERLLCSLTGAEAALVVNNNAAAVLLVLQALAQGKEVIVSRSQLVEIGGSFRMPDVMAQSGAKLVEVGTTNKTYLSDYRNAITDNTALLLKVHASNFRITGFTAEVSIEELMSLGRERGIPVAYDIGSGALRDLSAFGLASEPLVMHSVAAGADLTTFSGDKLLGGPQAGIILGKEKLVGRLKKHPLTRALRVGKLTLAALEATLRLYWDDEGVTQRLPVLRMIALPLVEVALRAELLARQIQAVVGPRFTLAVQDDVSTVGGGSLPGEVLPTKVVSVSANGLSPDDLATRLRTNHPPIFGRIADDKLLLDPRTIAESQSEAIVAAFQRMAPQSP